MILWNDTVRPNATTKRASVSPCALWQCFPIDVYSTITLLGLTNAILHHGVRDRYVEGVPSGTTEAATAYTKKTYTENHSSGIYQVR